MDLAGSVTRAAYAASVGGGVWKTTNCCSTSTTWSDTTDNNPIITATSIDTLTIDPNDHNTYAGTGDRRAVPVRVAVQTS